MNYTLLALDPNSRYMPLPVLRKIRSLVEEGAVVAGPKPLWSPSLSDDQAEFQLIVNQLWKTENSENSVGKGKIYAGKTVAEVLSSLQVNPDFEYSKPESDTKLLLFTGNFQRLISTGSITGITAARISKYHSDVKERSRIMASCNR